MSVTARYSFDPAVMAKLNVTIEITMTLDEWRDLTKRLNQIEGNHGVPLRNCITSVVRAIDTATGVAPYRTHGYAFKEAEQETSEAAE